MHVATFIFRVCVCMHDGTAQNKHHLQSAVSACGGSDDHGETDGNQGAFLTHSSLAALTPMGHFMWIYGACEGWRLSEKI